MPKQPKQPATPTEIWTPDAKLTEGQKKLGLMLFMECWKDALAKGKATIEQVKPTYVQCIKAAKIIDELKIEEELKNG
jgi:hypothetical protein